MTLAQQLRCAERELAKRKAVYPKMIEQRKLTQAKADEEIACMAAIVDTLERQKYLSEVSDQIRGGPIEIDAPVVKSNEDALTDIRECAAKDPIK